MPARAKLIELFSRAIVKKKDGRQEYYLNGDDNLYPYSIERVINNSPTAKGAAGVMAKYISGFIEDSENPIVNRKKNYRLSDVIKLIGEDLARQGGSFIWVGYGINDEGKITPNSLDVLDYKKCRICVEDDEENAGKIIYHDFNEKSSFGKKSEKKYFYPFSSNQAVLLERIKKEGKVLEEAIVSFKGQVFFLNPSNYIYPLAPIDPSYNDADTEYRIGEYTNTQTRSGFLGKTIISTIGMDEETEAQTSQDLAKFLGAENSGSIYYINHEMGTDLNTVLRIDQLKPQFDDKLFEATDKRLRKNILSCFNNIPEALIYSSDSALFGTNSETYKEMKTFYSEQTDYERSKVEETLNLIGFPCTIKSLIETENDLSEPNIND